ncbi:MAG: Ig-like domain-containing protein [Ignavibacterium sp.]|nr:MAG: Ig-like domain-containing protein [Ignavibacterium sp.]
MSGRTSLKSISKSFFILFILGITVFLFSCKEESGIVSDIDGGDDEIVTLFTIISGQLVDKQTGFPVDSGLVHIAGTSVNSIVYSDESGQFFSQVQLIEDENLTIIAYKQDYKPDTTSTTAFAGQDLTVETIHLEKLDDGTGPSGDPVSIFLSSISSTIIGVKESGSEETTQIAFVVQDSAGTPIDLIHQVTVNFRLGSGPGGGEFLSPGSASTNGSGTALVNLTSGTKAGAVQVIAEVDLGGSMISSLPVAVTIHGGLPDDTHFSIAPAKANFPGYNIYGLHNPITAFVGDKYANPVRPETAVYFTTTGGIIEGSTLTDIEGIGSVNLISAAPKPSHPILGAGFATITASTINENSNVISKETIVLFSGIPQVSISPTSINVPNRSSQSFSYYVGDQNGNPLASGTNISVSVEGENVDSQGDINITLPDTQSASWTQFFFLLYDTNDSLQTKPVTVRVETSGPNGGAFMTIGGVTN